MGWWGKFLGGAFGFLMGGPLGALMGAAFGHQFDRGYTGVEGAHRRGFEPGDRERVQGAFFTTTFAVMGHLAKADGRVSQDEITLARTVMERMGLSPQQKTAAKKLFNEGRQQGFPLDEVLAQFRQECHGRRNLLRMFVEIQLHAAYADRVLHRSEEALLLHMCERLGISAGEYQQLHAFVRAASQFAGAAPGKAAADRDQVRQAYKVLGVEPGADDVEVKKAYRRQMSRHHPDKLVSKGLPEEMIKLANEKAHEIKVAYETIREHRKAHR